MSDSSSGSESDEYNDTRRAAEKRRKARNGKRYDEDNRQSSDDEEQEIDEENPDIDDYEDDPLFNPDSFDNLTPDLQSSSFALSPSSTSNSTTINPSSSSPPPPDRSGWLWKRGQKNGEWQKRWFILSYQTLQYSHNPKEKAAGSIPLNDATIQTKVNEKNQVSSSSIGGTMSNLLGKSDAAGDKIRKGQGFIFEISAPGLGRSYLLQTDEQRNLIEWISALKANVEYLNAINNMTVPASTLASSNTAAIPIINTPSNRSLAYHQRGFSVGDLRPQRVAVSLKSKDLAIDDAWSNKIGITNRQSAWRKEAAIKGIQHAPSFTKFFARAFTPEDKRLKSAAAFAIHNTASMAVVGCGSGSALAEGSLQFIEVDSARKQFALSQPFGDLPAALAKPKKSKSLDEISTSDNNSITPILSSSRTSRCDGAIYNLDWLDDRLLCSSSGGVVAFYRSSPEDGVIAMSKNKPTHTYLHSNSLKIPAPTPNNWLNTSYIYGLSLNPLDKQSFLSVSNQYFYLWDLDRSTPLFTTAASIQPLYAACWNPHSQSEFIVAGQGGALRLLDGRLLSNSDKCVSWQCEQAHSQAIKDVAWSPLVPSWFASTGEDGTIKVWDLRFAQQPIRTLSSHQQTVNKLSWSRSHAELLISGSEDRTVKLWNLRIVPHYLIHTEVGFNGGVCGVSWSADHPHHFYGCATDGEVRLIEIGKEASMMFVPHRPRQWRTKEEEAAIEKEKQRERQKEETQQKLRSDELISATTSPILSSSNTPLTSATAIDRLVRAEWMEIEEKRIETSLYLRDLLSAFQSIATLSHRYWQLGYQDWASSILKLTSPALFTQTANESELKNKSFNTVVAELSRYVPAGTLKISKVDPETHRTIQFLKLRIALLKLMQAGKYKDVLALEKEIVLHLDPATIPIIPTLGISSQTDPVSLPGAETTANDSFDAVTLEKIVATVLHNHHVKAIRFAINIAITLRDNGNFPLFINVARLLFSPTVWDSAVESGGNPTAPAVPVSADDDKSDDESDESKENSVSKPSDSTNFNPLASPKANKSPTASSITGRTATSPSSATAAGGGATLDRDLRNPKLVIPQLELLEKLLTIVLNDEDSETENSSNTASSKKSPRSDRPIWNPYLPSTITTLKLTAETCFTPHLSAVATPQLCTIMETIKEPHLLLPTLPHRLHLNALQQQKKYDLVLINLSLLTHYLRRSAFALFLQDSILDITLSKFSKFLDKLLQKDAKQVWNTAKFIAGLLTLINILYHFYPPFPNHLESLITRYMNLFSRELSKAFHEMVTNRQYPVVSSTSTPKLDVKAKIEYLMQQVKNMKNKDRLSEDIPFVNQQVESFLQMLAQYDR